MSWQFTIVDFTTNPNGTGINIDEPVGWDAVTLHLKRDDKWHGFFAFEDDSFSSLQYDGRGARILRNAYYNYGVTAKVELHVSYQCDDGDPSTNLYLGAFDFTTFTDYTADRCYVECATVFSQALYQFKNRADQQVDLDSLASYDQAPVQQTVTCTGVAFQAAGDLIGESFGMLRIPQLLNGLMPGSKIIITGSAHNNGTFTVASAKPDYTSVNPDLVGANNGTSSPTVSATFNPINSTISINRLISIAVGAQINVQAPQLNYQPGHHYDNTGQYIVTAVQQFFNYTVLTVKVSAITDATADNYQLPPASGFMVAQSADSVTLTGPLITTAQPTATIVTVAELVTNEIVSGYSITLTGEWLQNNMRPYTALAKVITIPAKEIVAETLYENAQELIVDFKFNNDVNSGVPFSGDSFVTPELPDIINDIDESDVGTGVPVLGAFNSGSGNPPNTSPDTVIFFRQGSLACSGQGKLKYNINFQWIPYNGSDPQSYHVNPGSLIIKVGTDPTNLPIASLVTDSGMSRTTFPMNSMANISGEVAPINFPPGTYLWFYFHASVTNNSGAFYPLLVIGAGSYIEFDLSSECAETPCAVYFVAEALSRCTESYTNGQMVAYSDYFGRANAQPFPSAADGCGGLEVITNGLRIRGCVMPDGSSIPKFFSSVSEMFDALDAIHNTGMALEADPNRPGFSRIRIEPFEYFFQNVQLIYCARIFKYQREIQPSLLPSTFKVGYQQFETWNNNGLYDIFGSRSYRTPLNQLQNGVDKTCKWMASDYAIEFTRREFGVTTADSRYDSSTFILCLKNKYEGPVEFVGSCFLTWYVFTGGITVGDSLTISNTNSNNLTGTVSRIQPSASGDGLMAYIFLTGITFTNEFTISANIKNNTHPQTYGNGSIPAFFIGANGAIMLDEFDLFNAQDNDSIVIGNTVHNNGTYIIAEIFSPQSACNFPDCPENFPMVIFPSTPLAGMPEQVEFAGNCTVNDLTNQFYIAEQGLENGTNILSPGTVMNYRISPARNAMRHFRNIICDRNYKNQRLIFTGGEGNFYALGQLSDNCSPENGNISEGGDLSAQNFTIPLDAEPLFYAELVKFDYPLTWKDFLKINANPYGLIAFERSTEGVQQGWLVDLEYKPYTGMASFSLYPKIK